jgi:hypothetical protein
MDQKIIQMLLDKLVNRADEVDSDEVMGQIKPLRIEDGNDPERYHSEPDGDESDEDKLAGLFK